MSIQLHDKTFVPFISREEIQQAVKKIADAINADYTGKSPILLPVLDGAFVFTADLARLLTIPAQFSFIKFKSYHNTQSTGLVNRVMGLDIDVTGKDIILIEDIIDTGLTIGYLAEEMKLYSPASIKTVALFSKPEAILTKVPIDYNGIEIANRFIVGYGMDYNGLGRNLDAVYVVV